MRPANGSATVRQTNAEYGADFEAGTSMVALPSRRTAGNGRSAGDGA